MSKPWYLSGMTPDEILADCKRRKVRAVSVRQPYADQIVYGQKDCEYRYPAGGSGRKGIRGPVLVYASNSTSNLGPDEIAVFPTGCFVGCVTVAGWNEDRGGYDLAHPIPFGEAFEDAYPYRDHTDRQPQPFVWYPWGRPDSPDPVLARVADAGVRSAHWGVFTTHKEDPEGRVLWLGVRHRSARTARAAAKKARQRSRIARVRVFALRGIDLDNLPPWDVLTEWYRQCHKPGLQCETVAEYRARLGV